MTDITAHSFFPAFVGGILPMLSFGIMDFLYRIFAQKIPFHIVFFYTSLGGFFTMFIFGFLLFGFSFENIISLFSFSALLAGIILGILWSIAIVSIGYAYEYCHTNGSQIVPISSASGLFGAFLGIVFLDEKLSLEQFFLSAFFIFIGILLIIFSEKKQISSGVSFQSLKQSLKGVIIGGFIPFFAFGILNILYKVWGEYNAAVLAIMMTIIGMITAGLIQWNRKTSFEKSYVQIMTAGIAWACAVAFLGYGFWPLGGDASTLLPIAGSSPLIALILFALFVKEPVYWGKVSIGTVCIVTGIIFISL